MQLFNADQFKLIFLTLVINDLLEDSESLRNQQTDFAVGESNR